MKLFFALAIIVAIQVCFAQNNTTQPVIVMGNNSEWTRVCGVKANAYAIQVQADGIVDFGCMFGACRDSATAGVNGNAVWRFVHEQLGNNLDALINDPWNNLGALRAVFGTEGPVNYDQGGVWIKVTTTDGRPVVSTQLYYYWCNLLNKLPVKYSQDVVVWAKAHDGGRSAESRSSYGDNRGYYRVWLVLTRVENPPDTF